MIGVAAAGLGGGERGGAATAFAGGALAAGEAAAGGAGGDFVMLANIRGLGIETDGAASSADRAAVGCVSSASAAGWAMNVAWHLGHLPRLPVTLSGTRKR